MRIKQILSLTSLAILVLALFAGCNTTTRAVTCDEVIAAYKAAGYNVSSHLEYPEKDYGYLCEVAIENDDGDSVRFHFFETEAEAEAYADERQWNGLLWAFSVIYGDPTWLETKTHGNIEIEYDDEDLIKPFRELITSAALQYPAGIFFDAELLDECTLADMPVPSLENTRLDGKVLYCNLTDAEYSGYVEELVAYLRSREDIAYLGSYSSGYLLAEIAPVDVFGPLPEDYDCTADSHLLAFSTVEELSGNGMLKDPVRISVTRISGQLSGGSFSYNTRIRLTSSEVSQAEWDLCALEHHFGDGVDYPIIGTDDIVTIRTCVNCGQETRSGYSGNSQFYAVNLIRGRNYILGNNWNQTVTWDISSMHAGAKIEITVRVPESGITVLVNGEAVPVLHRSENTLTVGFIMPQEVISIEIYPTPTEETE